jgi:hypothetical protein
MHFGRELPTLPGNLLLLSPGYKTCTTSLAQDDSLTFTTPPRGPE